MCKTCRTLRPPVLLVVLDLQQPHLHQQGSTSLSVADTSHCHWPPLSVPVSASRGSHAVWEGGCNIVLSVVLVLPVVRELTYGWWIPGDIGVGDPLHTNLTCLRSMVKVP